MNKQIQMAGEVLHISEILSKPLFLLRKIPLPYSHYCYVLAEANINDQMRISIKEIVL